MISIIGCGPGSPEYLTSAAIREAEQAEILVGTKRVLDLFSNKEALRIYAGTDINEVLDAISKNISARIVVAVSGDPGVSSLARPVRERFGASACRIIPGVSSVQLAFARLSADWTDAKIISAHGRIPSVSHDELRGVNKIAVLCGGAESPHICRRIHSLLSGDWDIAVCENLSMADEKISSVSADALSVIGISSRTIIIFIRKDEHK